MRSTLRSFENRSTELEDYATHSIKRMLSELSISSLFALAIGGLVFPVNLFAQPSRVLDLGELEARGHFQIDILEMATGDEMPTRFRVDNGAGNRVIFEYRDGGYTWRDESRPDLNGFQRLPSLNKALSWKAASGADGLMRARVPLADLGYANADSAPFDTKLGFERSAPAADVLGVYNDEQRAFELAMVTPDQQLVDFTVSFAGLPDEVRLGDSSERPGSKFVITITWVTVLIIIGLATIGCAAIMGLCFWACNASCPNGVKRVISAVCGVGCTCDCK